MTRYTLRTAKIINIQSGHCFGEGKDGKCGAR